VAYTFKALQTELSEEGQIGDLYSVKFKAVGDGEFIHGTLMKGFHTAPLATSASGTAYELGAVTAAQKLYVAMHVTDVSGVGATLDMIVQSDDAEGFLSPTTRATLTQVTLAGGSTHQWMEVAGPVTDTWWRVGWTVAGATPSVKGVIVVGIQ